jgi:hypothetical protein
LPITFGDGNAFFISKIFCFTRKREIVMKSRFFIAGVFILIAGLMLSKNGIDGFRQARQSEHWPITHGIVLHADATEPKNNRETFNKRFTYEYVVNGTTYKGHTLFFGQNIGDVRFISAEYSTGNKVDVFYDPSNPGISVLQPSEKGKTILILIVGAGLFVVGAGVMLLNRRSMRKIRVTGCNDLGLILMGQIVLSWGDIETFGKIDKPMRTGTITYYFITEKTRPKEKVQMPSISDNFLDVLMWGQSIPVSFLKDRENRRRQLRIKIFEQAKKVPHLHFLKQVAFL